MGTIEKAYFKLEDAAFKVEKANPGADDASKKKVTDAWDLWNAESLKYNTKQTEMDGLNAQIKEMQEDSTPEVLLISVLVVLQPPPERSAISKLDLPPRKERPTR